MNVTQDMAPAVARAVDGVARDGQVLSAGDGTVVSGLDGIAYQFTLAGRDDAPMPAVLLVATALMLPHGTRAFNAVYDEQDGGPYVVADGPASRIIAAHDRHGQCRMCAAYHHEQCVAQTGDACTCGCAAERLAVQVAAAAMAVMMDAPTTRPDNSWNVRCLCACQDGGDCGGCGHLGCATRPGGPAALEWLQANAQPHGVDNAGAAAPRAGDAVEDPDVQPVAGESGAYEEMTRWEPASGAELHPGDVICLDAAAVSALIALDPGGVEWSRLRERAFTIAVVSARRGTTYVTVHGQAGRLALEHDVVLRLAAPAQPEATA